MGDHEGWAQPSDLLPNGLLPNGEAYMTRILDQERWSIAEERTADLIGRIQPNGPSEELRNAVAGYVQRLISKCFSCQVFTFGSVPLKTYLPDGDIDLTAFSKNQNIKDTWANEVRIMLENEEKSENAEFHVKEVQYIQAEVKIIKCLVENIVVDISFNQLGGLCTLCFLEEVDNLINQNHLFKRSIILIKAWCYYESRILGAHHGLISTYALETLVLYIFHVFNNSFTGPLEVLYRFLEFFSNFDWENFCVSLWGPVPIRSLPDMTAESPRKDSGELLLSRPFLDACSSVYAVFPAGQENQGQPFLSKHFNVIDPLRTNNNLGRSVSKGNFFRIRSAFAFGAKKLARLLECPKEDIFNEVNQFFMNTWERHGSGHRPDAPSAGLLHLQQLNSDIFSRPENLKNKLSSKKKNENLTSHESEAEENHAVHGISHQHANCTSEGMSRTSYIPSQSKKTHGNRTSSKVSDQVVWNVGSVQTVDNERGQRRSKPDYVATDAQERCQFVRTRSSPELLDTSMEISARGRRNRAPEAGKNHIDSIKPDYSSRKKNLASEVSGSHSARSSTNDPGSMKYNPSHQRVAASADSNSASNNYLDEASLSIPDEELSSLSEAMEMHQEEQDLVNMMAASGFHGFNGPIQMPVNMGAPPLHFPMSYAQRNLSGMIPGSISQFEHPWGPNIQALVPSYFHNMGLASNPEEMADSDSVNPGFAEVNQEHAEQDFWNENETGTTRDFSDVNGNIHTMQFDDKHHPNSAGYNLVSSSRNSSGSSMRDQRKSAKASRGIVREDQEETLHYQHNKGNEGYSAERTANLRSLSASHTSSSRSKASSESSFDGTSVKVSRPTRDKRGRKTSAPSPVASAVAGKGKGGLQYEGVPVDHSSPHANDGVSDWIQHTTMTEMAERSVGTRSVSSSHIHNHHMPSYDSAQMSDSESMLHMPPMVLGSGSRQQHFTFYPTGPPVPFIAMLPVYKLPTEMGNSEGTSSHFDKEEDMDGNHIYESDQNIDSECPDQSEILSTNSTRNGPTLEPLEEHKSDILNSDFPSHWQNLQFARFCQNPRHHGPVLYHPPVVVPPMYLQGHFPLDGPGRPHSSNANVFSQFMGYGPRLVPVAPLQPSPNRPAGVYQRYGDEIPRYRGGTGTYLPNLKVPLRERQSSGNKNHRGNYSYEQHDHLGDRDGNWNVNAKPRYSGRHYGRSQSEKGSSRPDRLATNDNRTNRPWDSYRHESSSVYHQENGPAGSSNPMRGGSTNGVHGVYSLQAMNSNGVAQTGPGVPSVVMLYSYDHNVGYGSTAEQVEFGSFGPAHFSGINDVSQRGEVSPGRGMHEQQRFREGSALSSPDQPSSPQFQRLAVQRNYQLKDEDFPPLSFPSHGGNGDVNNYNGKLSHYQATTLFTSANS